MTNAGSGKDPVRKSLGTTPGRARDREVPAVLYIDLHLVHEVTSPQAFAVLQRKAAQGASPGSHPCNHRSLDSYLEARCVGTSCVCPARPTARSACCQKNCAEFGLQLFDVGSGAPGHRARHRPGTRRHAAGQDHRLWRQPYQHPRRIRRAGLRHRHDRGRARAGHPVPVAEKTSHTFDYRHG